MKPQVAQYGVSYFSTSGLELHASYMTSTSLFQTKIVIILVNGC